MSDIVKDYSNKDYISSGRYVLIKDIRNPYSKHKNKIGSYVKILDICKDDYRCRICPHPKHCFNVLIDNNPVACCSFILLDPKGREINDSYE